MRQRPLLAVGVALGVGLLLGSMLRGGGVPDGRSSSPRGFGAAARVTALAASVMDLHVRIALQEVDREKRRLIGGGLFLAIGGTAMFLALLAGEASLLLWIQAQWDLGLDPRTVEPCGGQPGAGGHQLAHWRPGAEGPVPASDAGGTDENGAGSNGSSVNVFANS